MVNVGQYTSQMAPMGQKEFNLGNHWKLNLCHVSSLMIYIHFLRTILQGRTLPKGTPSSNHHIDICYAICDDNMSHFFDVEVGFPWIS